MDKKSFVLYTESYQQIKKLNNTQKAQLLDAVFIYFSYTFSSFNTHASVIQMKLFSMQMNINFLLL